MLKKASLTVIIIIAAIIVAAGGIIMYKIFGQGVQGVSADCVKDMQVTSKSFHNKELDGSSQVIVVTSDKMGIWDAHLETYQQYNGKWYQGLSVDSKIGLAGLVYPEKRVEGSMTTPIGVYDMPYAFGVKKNPGTKMPYGIVGENTYYDGMYGSKTYNKLVEGMPDNKEYEYMFNEAYLYGADIAFNMEEKVNKGNAIFLHCNTESGYTAGCVSVSENDMIKILKWMTPASKPKILICLKSELSKYFS